MNKQEDNLTAGEFVTATVAAVLLIVGAAIAGAKLMATNRQSSAPYRRNSIGG